eukprot:scaffold30418_cov66-Phaeocystis_antarctica.AAC.4
MRARYRSCKGAHQSPCWMASPRARNFSRSASSSRRCLSASALSWLCSCTLPRLSSLAASRFAAWAAVGASRSFLSGVLCEGPRAESGASSALARLARSAAMVLARSRASSAAAATATSSAAWRESTRFSSSSSLSLAFACLSFRATRARTVASAPFGRHEARGAKVMIEQLAILFGVALRADLLLPRHARERVRSRRGRRLEEEVVAVVLVIALEHLTSALALDHAVEGLEVVAALGQKEMGGARGSSDAPRRVAHPLPALCSRAHRVGIKVLQHRGARSTPC